MRAAVTGEKCTWAWVMLTLTACHSTEPDAPPNADRVQESREAEQRWCEEFVVRDYGARPEHQPLVTCAPGGDAACVEGSVCVTWEGTSACAVQVDDPGQLSGVTQDAGLVVIARAPLNAGLDSKGRCATETPEPPVTTPVNKRDVLRLSRVEGERLTGLLCQRRDGAEPECPLPIHQTYRLIGYYHPPGTLPAGATFEVLYAEPAAP